MVLRITMNSRDFSKMLFGFDYDFNLFNRRRINLSDCAVMGVVDNCLNSAILKCEVRIGHLNLVILLYAS